MSTAARYRFQLDLALAFVFAELDALRREVGSEPNETQRSIEGWIREDIESLVFRSETAAKRESAA